MPVHSDHAIALCEGERDASRADRGGLRRWCRLVLLAGVGAAASLLFGHTRAQASTIHTFYYVGAVATEKRDETVPDFNTGYFQIDAALLPGQTLASASLTWSYFGGVADELSGENHEALLSYGFRLSSHLDSNDPYFGGPIPFNSVALTFDGSGSLSSWLFQGNTDTFGFFSFGYDYTISTSGERYDLFGWQYLVPPFDEDDCWPLGSCIDARIFRASVGGVWFKDDPLGFASQVEAMTRQAAVSPPQVIPLPTPLALALGGLASLVLVGRRRSSA